MVSVGIRELKNNLSRYLVRVRDGETVVVTDRGKPIARIENVEDDDLPEPMKRLIASGEIDYVGKPKYIPKLMELLPGDDGKTMVDYIREQRR
ncbi:MAG: type II toxin-antitoxin system prevent-host-death family antitoxin [Dehalococcoidia bacterium]